MRRSPASRWRRCVHGAVGTQHAAMAIYNAYCDRVPMLIFAGNPGALDERRPGVEWFHSVQDGAATVRDFVKWDDYPMSLQHFAELTVRGYALACAQPPGPVFLTADIKLQEDPLDEREQRRLRIPRLATALATRRRSERRARGRQNAGGGRNSRHHCGSLCALASSDGRSRQACRALAGARDRQPVAHEHAEHALSLPVGAGGRLDRVSRLHPVARAGRSLRPAQRDARPAGAHREPEDQEGREGHQHLDPRSAGAFQLPGLPALCRRRHQYHGGRPNDVAVPDRSRAARNQPPAARTPSRCAARRCARPITASPNARVRRRRWHGTRARSPRRGCIWSSGSSSGTRTGRWSRTAISHPGGRIACGRWKNTTASSAAQAAMAWAISRLPRLGRRSRIATPADAWSSASPATASSTWRRIRCGPPHTMAFPT